jgi:hypothetical protein
MAVTSAPMPRRRRLVMIGLSLLILVPAGIGFGTKLREFFILYLGDNDGAFTAMPLLNYLLASAGFFFLFCWAMVHGMFRDIEKPGKQMLEIDQQLDEEEEFERRFGECPHMEEQR